MKRIAKELPLDESALTTMQSVGPRTAPKVAFGAVVETGLIPPARRCSTRSVAGSPPCGPMAALNAAARPARSTGLGKELQGAPSCNGWVFWQYETDRTCSRSTPRASFICWRARTDPLGRPHMTDNVYLHPITLVAAPQAVEGDAVRLGGSMAYAREFALLARGGGRRCDRADRHHGRRRLRPV